MLIGKLWHGTDPMVFGVAGASLDIAATAAYFGYLRKLRRDIDELERARGYLDRVALTVSADHQAPARFQPRARLP